MAKDKIINMREITEKDYMEFLKKHKEIIIHDRIGKKEIRIKLNGFKKNSRKQTST